MSTIYAEHTLILMHLPDETRDDAIVPVRGVVVRSNDQETTVRVRDRSGNIKEITVDNDELEVR